MLAKNNSPTSQQEGKPSLDPPLSEPLVFACPLTARAARSWLQVDVYSFSMIMYQLFQGLPPFWWMHPVDAAKAAALHHARPEWGQLNRAKEVVSPAWALCMVVPAGCCRRAGPPHWCQRSDERCPRFVRNSCLE